MLGQMWIGPGKGLCSMQSFKILICLCFGADFSGMDWLRQQWSPGTEPRWESGGETPELWRPACEKKYW